MSCGQISAGEATSAFGWARQVLSRQIYVVARLIGLVGRLVEAIAKDHAPDGAPPPRLSLADLEAALFGHIRITWVLRLIDALRTRLRDDQARVDRGELPDFMLEPPPRASDEPADAGEKPEVEAVERPDRDDFSAYFGRRRDNDITEILKRPTDEIIALICKELGLPADWLQRMEDRWEREQNAVAALEPGDRPHGETRGEGSRAAELHGLPTARPPPS